ncbi:MAG: PAS domain-containing protein [Gammaproteobacteria bacterium]|nr:PAS domain-containing protein [Gammaproteobacteria bacterium]
MLSPSGDAANLNASPWKTLRLLNMYRLALAVLFIAVILIAGPKVLGQHDPFLFVAINALYFFFLLAFGVSGQYRWPALGLQVYAQALIDIVAITLLMHASGGIGSGLGVLMIAAVAAASVLAPGRAALGVAALAALTLLGAEVHADLFGNYRATSYTQTGLLGASLFATAWLTVALSRRARMSEALAVRRGIDLANLAELNGLIVNRMQSGIIVVDDTSEIRLMNSAARALLGCATDEYPRGLKELSYPLYRLFLQWLPAHETNPAPQKLEHDHAATLQARFSRVGARREDRGVVIYVDDTAEINRQIQETKLASLSRLTASIAHEIRNPLGAISHAAQLLGESPGLDRADQRMVDMIRDQSKRMNAVIHDVLRLYRREQPHADVIRVTAHLDVTDRGPGIDPELRAQLFEPFVTSSTQGTGLGLFMARELCHANGGELSYTPGAGGGSTFRIQFPLSMSGQTPRTGIGALDREIRADSGAVSGTHARTAADHKAAAPPTSIARARSARSLT